MNTDRFKFRVWDKKEKGYKPCAIFWDGEVYDCDVMTCYIGAVAQEPDRYIIEQSTGLKDRNGKLIFEGDVCRNIRNGEILSVAWHHNFAVFIWNKKQDNSCLYDFGALFRVFDKFEIIGNIHDMEKDK